MVGSLPLGRCRRSVRQVRRRCSGSRTAAGRVHAQLGQRRASPACGAGLLARGLGEFPGQGQQLPVGGCAAALLQQLVAAQVAGSSSRRCQSYGASAWGDCKPTPTRPTSQPPARRSAGPADAAAAERHVRPEAAAAGHGCVWHRGEPGQPQVRLCPSKGRLRALSRRAQAQGGAPQPPPPCVWPAPARPASLLPSPPPDPPLVLT